MHFALMFHGAKASGNAHALMTWVKHELNYIYTTNWSSGSCLLAWSGSYILLLWIMEGRYSTAHKEC